MNPKRDQEEEEEKISSSNSSSSLNFSFGRNGNEVSDEGGLKVEDSVLLVFGTT